MLQHESFIFSNVAAATYAVSVIGGRYRLAAKATWGGGSLKLQAILPDGSTAIDLYGIANTSTPGTQVSSLSADGVLDFYLPPGAHQLVFATGSALYASLTRMPLE